MRSWIFRAVAGLWVGGLLLVSAGACAQQDIGVVRGEVQGLLRRVQIESSNAQLQRLLQQVFSAHGAFEVRTGGQVHFVFKFEPAGANAVRLAIASGGSNLLEQEFQGGSVNKAALAAADYAVKRTTNLEGFFSGTVAFISDQSGNPEVYLADFPFTTTRRLTRDNSQSLLPALSPDARYLLYTSYHRSGFPDIYRIDLRTNQRSIFASYRGLNSGATYSPSGEEVAMILSGSGNSEVYVSDSEGEQMRRLTRTTGLEADPSWSPDGRRLVFTSDEMGKPQIFTMSANGSGMRRLPTNISGNCSEPNWNPVHANLVAFTAAMGREFEVCLWDFDSQQSRVITRGAGDAVEPQWMNDGRHLIYTERTSRTSRLVLLDSVSGKKTYLTNTDMGRCSMADFVAVPAL